MYCMTKRALFLIPRLNRLRFGSRIFLARRAPCLQRQRQPRRFAIGFGHWPQHITHPGQKTRTARIIARLDRWAKRPARFCVIRRSPFGVQPAFGVLAFFARPGGTHRVSLSGTVPFLGTGFGPSHALAQQLHADNAPSCSISDESQNGQTMLPCSGMIIYCPTALFVVLQRTRHAARHIRRLRLRRPSVAWP